MKSSYWFLFLFISLPRLGSALISCEEACASCDDEEIPSVLREVHCSMCQECKGKNDRQDAEIVFPPGCPLPLICQPMFYCPPPCPTSSAPREKLTHRTTTTTTELPKPRPTLGPSTKKKLVVTSMPCCMPMCAAPCYPWPVTQQQQTTQKLAETETTPESAESPKDYDYVYVGVEKQKLRHLRRLNPS